MPVTKDILIEDLVEQLPQAIKYLMKHGIVCIICGEPIWGTLEEAARNKGFTDDDVAKFVVELNKLVD